MPSRWRIDALVGPRSSTSATVLSLESMSTASGAGASGAIAQSYPTRPIRLIVLHLPNEPVDTPAGAAGIVICSGNTRRVWPTARGPLS